MQKEFTEYYNLSAKDIKHIWENGLFVFDTNVLLNFYRYSDNTVRQFSKILEKFRGKLLLPHQIGKEFHEERLNVIQQQIKIYYDSHQNINGIEDEFSSKNRNPFLSDKLFKKFSEVIKQVEGELKEKTKKYEERILDDDILVTISKIFDGVISEQLPEKKTKEIYDAGNKRYTEKIPPGYEDKNKPDNKKFGDLIIWFQMIEAAKKANKPILFITDERKEDWWLIHAGKIITPRPELRKEFWNETQNLFHIYQPFRFLEYATNALKMEVDRNTIDEVKQLKPIKKIEKNVGVDKDLLITITLEEVAEANELRSFVDIFVELGYEVHWEKVAKQKFKVFIPVPDIPDLSRRIKRIVIGQVNNFGFKMLDFTPNVE